MEKQFCGETIRLYYFNNIRYNTLTKQQKDCVYSLKGKILNDLPLIGGFCWTKCIIEDVQIDGVMVYFKFNFEIEKIKLEGNMPVKYISHLIIESTNYINKGISAISSKEEIHYEKVLSIINAIPSFVSLKLNPGFQFKYSPQSFKDITFEEEKLEYLKAFFENNLVFTKNNEKSCFTFIQTNEILDQDITPLKALNIKGKCKTIQYYFKGSQGKKYLSIDCKGKILSSYMIEKNTFKEIIYLVYILYKVPKIDRFLNPIDRVMEEYLSFIHEQVNVDAKLRHTSMIISDLRSIITQVTNRDNIGIVYITIVLNILTLLCTRKNLQTDYCIKIELMEYSELIDFLKMYTKKKFGQQINDEKLMAVICKMSHLIQLSQLEEDSLISLFRKESL